MRALSVLILPTLAVLAAAPVEATNLSGKVSDPHGNPLHGIFVSAKQTDLGVTRSAVTDEEGVYRMLELPPGPYTLVAHQVGYRDAKLEDQTLQGSDMTFDFTVRVNRNIAGQIPASTIVGLLPDGDLKRRVMLDCMSCHQFSAEFVTRRGRARTREDWVKAITAKQKMFGPGSRYPVMSGTLDPETTADWLIEHLGGPGDPTPPLTAPPLPEGKAATMQLTEIDFPKSRDLPTGIALDGEGNVLLPGMITHAVYVLDPEEFTFRPTTIPVSVANPHFLRVDASGRWWTLLGFPQKLAAYDPASQSWDVTPLGFFPEHAAMDAGGKVWVAGGFTKDPARFASIDPASGALEVFEVPAGGNPPPEGPFPSGIAVGAGGEVWITELTGNRLVRFDPADGSTKAWPLPEPNAGPRRPAVAGDGTVWIPEFTGNALTAFDPATGTFTRFPAPRPDVLPYAAAVDPRNGRVWVTEAAGDALLRFDPADGTFTEFRLPSQTAFMRDLVVDPKSGAVWTSTSPNPGTQPRVVKLETR